MNLRRAAGAFLALLGGLMIAVWVGLFATDQVPEVRTAPISLTFLLAAEMTTAVLSLVSGAGVVARRTWGYRAYLLASGMMLYSITNCLGVLTEAGQLPMAVLFSAFLVLTVSFLVKAIPASGRAHASHIADLSNACALVSVDEREEPESEGV